MLAQIVLTPAESKKLIAKAVAKLEAVQQAAKTGIVALHPSSSTYFIIEEITGSIPKTNYWVCGVVTPRGMCVEMAMALGIGLTPHDESTGPGDLQGTWVIEKGQLPGEEKLSSLLYRMAPSDVYVKGVNALDRNGNVGILFGLEGSMGYIHAARKKRNFTIIYPAGLEKLIPLSVKEAAKEAKLTRYESGMGMPVGLFRSFTSARPSSAGWGSNRFRRSPAFRRSSAAKICSSRSNRLRSSRAGAYDALDPLPMWIR
jgi:hypothetical protein